MNDWLDRLRDAVDLPTRHTWDTAMLTTLSIALIATVLVHLWTVRRWTFSGVSFLWLCLSIAALFIWIIYVGDYPRERRGWHLDTLRGALTVGAVLVLLAAILEGWRQLRADHTLGIEPRTRWTWIVTGVIALVVVAGAILLAVALLFGDARPVAPAVWAGLAVAHGRRR
jgi:hypothetical protein